MKTIDQIVLHLDPRNQANVLKALWRGGSIMVVAFAEQ